MRILIVGAGIMGLSTARAASLAGHEPVVLERGAVPNPQGSSVDQHRALRLTYGSMLGYAEMVLDALAAWERLWLDLGISHYAETGQLVLGEPDDPWVTASLAGLDRLGVAYHALSETELARRFPMIRPGASSLAVAVPRAGVLFAERIVRDLAAWLRRRGVQILEQTEVVAIDPVSARATLADGRVLEADAMAVTAGAWIGRLAPQLASILIPSRQVVLYRRAPAELRAAWANGPLIADSVERPANGFYALPAVGGTDLKWGDHRFSMAGDVDGDRTATAPEIAQVGAAARRSLKDVDRYEPVLAKSCFYTVTVDERFLAEQQGRTLIISACSGHGFKFGALVGERAAAALVDPTETSSFARWLSGEEAAGD